MKINAGNIISFCIAVCAAVAHQADEVPPEQESHLRSLKKKDKNAAAVTQNKKGVFPVAACPSAVTDFHPAPRSKADGKCSRGSACQTRFDSDRKGDKLIGNDINSVKGQQAAFKNSFGGLGGSNVQDILSQTPGQIRNFCASNGPTFTAFQTLPNPNPNEVRSPFEEQLTDVCICLLSGGKNCDRACGCGLVKGNIKAKAFGTFCDCYCACCKPV